jgi:hypothetical protein
MIPVHASRYGYERVTEEIFAGLWYSRAYEQRPPKEYTSQGTPWFVGNSTLPWEITPRRKQKVHRKNAREGEKRGDWNTVMRGGWNWKQSKMSSWLTSPRIIKNSFPLCGKSLFALSARMPPWRNSMKWVSGKCQRGSRIWLPMAWMGKIGQRHEADRIICCSPRQHKAIRPKVKALCTLVCWCKHSFPPHKSKKFNPITLKHLLHQFPQKGPNLPFQP